MTRADFTLIAEEIRRELDAWPPGSEGWSYGRDALISLARNYARSLKATNPRFDDRRFLEACGVSTVE